MELISLALESWPKIPQLTDNEQAEKVFKILYGNFDAAWTNLIRCQQEASSTKYVRMQHDQRKVLVSLLAEKKKTISGHDFAQQNVSSLVAHFLKCSLLS